MTAGDSIRLATLLDLELERLLRQPAFAAEAQRAQREFLGAMATAPADAPQQRRFCEWLLLERDSQTLGSPPWLVAASLQDEPLFEDSRVGLFLIERAGASAQVRDLQDQQRLDLISETHRLQPGDLLVGRLFARGDGSMLSSVAAVVFRPGQAVAAAFERDLGRLELDRRLTQREVEQLLQLHIARPQVAARSAGAASPQLEHVEAQLERLLRQGGATHSATAITQLLRQAPRFGPAVGGLLEQLAFDTHVDLDAVRCQMLELWNVLHPDADLAGPAPAGDAAPAPADADEELGDRLVRTLDEGLARGRDLEELFSELEAMAGVGKDAAEDEDEEAGEAPGLDEEREEEEEESEAGEPAEPPDRQAWLPKAPVAPDLTGSELVDLDPSHGDLAVLVQEYLWETHQQQSAAARTLQMLLELQQQSAVPHTDLEAVTGLDLTRLLLHVYLRTAPPQRAAAVHEAFAVVERFFRWAETTQEFELAAALQGCRDSLLQHVDRLSQLGQRLSNGAVASSPPPCLLRVEDVGERGFGVRLDSGDAHWIATDAAIAGLLRQGDLLLASLSPQPGGRGRLAGMVIALPADAEHLIG